MLSFLLRSIGFVLLTTAAMFAVIDGTKSIAASSLQLTSLGATWRDTNPDSLVKIQQMVESTIAIAWDPVMTTLLALPTSLILALLAFLFLKLGKGRRRPYI